MLIKYIFKKLFNAYEYPFEKSNEKIRKMKEAELTEYYLSAKRVIDERAYQQEMQELVRRYYQELAIKSDSPMERQAYRLTLKAIQDLDVRLRQLAQLYATPKIKKPYENLN